jgi:hypothetical protein
MVVFTMDKVYMLGLQRADHPLAVAIRLLGERIFLLASDENHGLEIWSNLNLYPRNLLFCEEGERPLLINELVVVQDVPEIHPLLIFGFACHLALIIYLRFGNKLQIVNIH